jgi:hypothetical protein
MWICGPSRDTSTLSSKKEESVTNAVLNISLNILKILSIKLITVLELSSDRLCGLVVRVLGYRSGGPGSILGTTKKKVVGLERGSLSLVSTSEELLDRKVAAPV